MSGRHCWWREALKSKVRIGASSDDSSFSMRDRIPSGPAALEISSLLRSFRTPFSVMLISGISVSCLEKRFER